MLTQQQRPLTTLDAPPAYRPSVLFWALFVCAFLYAFLLSLELLTLSCSLMAGPVINDVVAATRLPLTGVCVGILATATVQSSSAITSILVALVSVGTMTLEQAVPIVIGANIGTTFTACLVSLGHISSKKEFRKGFAAALLHNFFNIGTGILFYVLEIRFGLLTLASRYAARGAGILFEKMTGAPGFSLTSIVSPVAQSLVRPGATVWFWAAIALIMLFGCLILFRAFLKITIIGDMEQNLDDKVFKDPIRAFLVGIGLTAFIHSSTVTTSLAVPLAATNKVGVRKLFPFIIGANIGTTVTALIAAISRSEAAVSLAMSHFLFNAVGALLILPIPAVKTRFVNLARTMARAVAHQRSLVLVFLVGFFFVLPILVLYLSRV